MTPEFPRAPISEALAVTSHVVSGRPSAARADSTACWVRSMFVPVSPSGTG